MSPVAVMHSPGLKADIPRRPSPWHEIAHSLSETALPTRRLSASAAAGTPPLSLTTPPEASPSPALSSSALREWDRLLSSSSDVKRHQLVHPSSSPRQTAPSQTSSPGPPKLAAERDKDGHIEYKLKLIDPTPERFDKLVTQMLWRLKQGRNEAIYELGLAGLTRPEMDASLRTLELMASEVGATVIVLREVVLVGGPAPRARLTPVLSPSVSSSALSASNGESPKDAWAWPVVRPDLDAQGQPRAAVMGGKKWRGRARRERRLAERERMRNRRIGNTSDDDVPPFHLDMDDFPVNPAPWRVYNWQHERKGRRCKGQPAHPESQLEQGDPCAPLPFTHIRNQRSQPSGDGKKMSAKAVKAAARREQRRLDLYRGDGTGELWLDMESATRDAAEAEAPAVNHTPLKSVDAVISGTPPACVPMHPYQPARPSSLRLATAPPTLPQLDRDDPFLAELLLLPLDNLSLSFAEVRTVTDPYELYDDARSHTDTTSHDSDSEEETTFAPSPVIAPTTIEPGQEANISPEMICVEALVVRKTAEGVAGVEDWCEGGEDAWGFGYGDEDGEGDVGRDERVRVQMDDDPWGF